MSVADDLRAAKTLIDTPEKWCKGIKGGRNCAMYAIWRKTDGRSSFSYNETSKALGRALPRGAIKAACGGHPVVHFNDKPDTTHADIMALFDRAIAAAEPSQ